MHSAKAIAERSAITEPLDGGDVSIESLNRDVVLTERVRRRARLCATCRRDQRCVRVLLAQHAAAGEIVTRRATDALVER